MQIDVKYERLPLFCCICGRIDHGDRDCDENSGEHTPKKRFDISIRASPWERVGSERNQEGEKHGGVAKKLFVTMPMKVKKKQLKEEEDMATLRKQVGEMMHKLKNVDLEATREGEEGEQSNPLNEGVYSGQDRGGSKGSQEVAINHIEGEKDTVGQSQDQMKEQPQINHAVTKKDSPGINKKKKWSRVVRKEAKDGIGAEGIGVKRPYEELEREGQSTIGGENGASVKKRLIEITNQDVASPTKWALSGQ